MAIDRRKALLFGSAAVLRLSLFFAFPSLPGLLTGRVEISTPVTSFKRCKSSLAITYNQLLTVMQYRRVSSSTPITYPLMMEAFFIRHLCYCLSLRSFHLPSSHL